MTQRKTEKLFFWSISLGFILWSGWFIYESSFIAIDGQRYFALFDDAMISMRYAWNFSHGSGLVWNDGEYIQGYTNLLMTLLMTVATFVFDKSNAVLFIQIMGIGFMLGIAFISAAISSYIFQEQDERWRTLIRILVFISVLFYYPLTYWSLMGMETGLLSFLVLIAILCAFKYIETQKISFVFLMSIILGLAYMARNDSIIFAFLIFLYIGWETISLKILRKMLLPLLIAGGLYSVFVIGQFAFQYLYYGEWMPNTYTLKLVGMPLGARIRNGIAFVKIFLEDNYFVLLLSGAGMIIRFQKSKLLLISLVISAITYEIYVGGDPWYYWRIMSPVMPLAILLFINFNVFFVSKLDDLFKSLRGKSILRIKFLAEGLVIVIALWGLLLSNSEFYKEILFMEPPYESVANRSNTNVAIAINEVTTPDASIAVIWGGSIPYYADRRAIDILGKSDKYIANLPPIISEEVNSRGMTSIPGHNKYDLNYSIKILEPTYLQGSGRYGQDDFRAWVLFRYEIVSYKGQKLRLLRDSDEVLWSKVSFGEP